MYEPVPTARFRLEKVEGTERIIVPAARSIFLMLFLSLWLVGWAFGFSAALFSVVNGEGGLFLIVWLLLWTLGGLFAASIVVWQFSGREYLAIEKGALLHGWKMAGFSRERHYDLAHVSNLRANESVFPLSWMFRPTFPPFFPTMFGAVKWNYGSKTFQAAMGASEVEGEMIVESLNSRMPVAFR
jgi:hypothetical protein